MKTIGDETTKKAIRDFEQPPVVEVLFGVQFASLPKLLTPHVGAFWQRIREEFPSCQDQPPLSPAIEGYGEQVVQNIQLTNIPPLPRTWFVHRDETSVVQIQRDRFLHNWRKVKESDDYPRYDQVIEPFLSSLDSFSEFVSVLVWGQRTTMSNGSFEEVAADEILTQGDIVLECPVMSWNPDARDFSAASIDELKAVKMLPSNAGRLPFPKMNPVSSNNASRGSSKHRGS